jgi:alpha-L-fucosidase
MKKYVLTWLIFIALLMGAAPLRAQAPQEAETKAQRDARMEWWREAKFGMFIHWGVYSVPAGYYNGKPVPGIGEWIMNKAKIPMTRRNLTPTPGWPWPKTPA